MANINKENNPNKINNIEEIPNIKDQDLELLLDEDFDTNYKCSLEADDIISKTDYFNIKDTKPSLLSKIFNIITSKPYSYATVTILCLLIGFVGILIGGNANLNDYEVEPNKPYNEYLSNYEVEIINENTIINEYIPCYVQNFEQEIDLYFFRGYTKDNKIIYFIKYDSNNEIPYINVKLNESTIYLSDDNIQILTIKDNYEGEYEIIYIDVTVNNQTSSHSIMLYKLK